MVIKEIDEYQIVITFTADDMLRLARACTKAADIVGDEMDIVLWDAYAMAFNVSALANVYSLYLDKDYRMPLSQLVEIGSGWKADGVLENRRIEKLQEAKEAKTTCMVPAEAGGR